MENGAGVEGKICPQADRVPFGMTPGQHRKVRVR
jgi:hypothetical protein